MRRNKNTKKKLFYLLMLSLGVFITIFQLYKITPPIWIAIIKKQNISNAWYIDTFIIVVDLIAMTFGTIIYPYVNYKLVDKNEDIFTILRKQQFNELPLLIQKQSDRNSF